MVRSREAASRTIWHKISGHSSRWPQERPPQMRSENASRRALRGLQCEPSPGSRTCELENVESRIGVGQVHQSVAIDIAVARLNDLWPVRARVHHPGGIGGHVVGDLARLERVLDVVGGHTRIVA